MYTGTVCNYEAKGEGVPLRRYFNPLLFLPSQVTGYCWHF